MKRRELLAQISEFGGEIILVFSLIVIAGLALPGCRGASGSSGGAGDILAYSLGFEMVPGSAVADHQHEFTFTQAEVDAGGPIAGFTDFATGHTHQVLISTGDVDDIVNNMQISGRTLTTENAPPHFHDWGLGPTVF